MKHYGFAPLLDVLFWLSAGTLAVSAVYWLFEERLMNRIVSPDPHQEEQVARLRARATEQDVRQGRSTADPASP